MREKKFIYSEMMIAHALYSETLTCRKRRAMFAL